MDLEGVDVNTEPVNLASGCHVVGIILARSWGICWRYGYEGWFDLYTKTKYPPSLQIIGETRLLCGFTCIVTMTGQ